MRKISIVGELGWARPGTFYDIAPLDLYYLRATIFEGRGQIKRASRNTYLLCVYGTFEAEVRGMSVKIEQGDLLEIQQGEECNCHARGRALVVVLDP